MIYVLTYNIDGITGPTGSVSTEKARILELAKSTGEAILDQLGDSVTSSDWTDLGGEDADPRWLLQSDDPEEILNAIGQIDDELQSQRLGCIHYWEYTDLFEFAKDQGILSWCPEDLKVEISQVQKQYSALVQRIDEEWGWI